MRNLVTTTTSEALLQACEDNMIAFWSPYGRARGNHLQSDDKLMWFYTGIQFPLFNGVIAVNAEVDEVKTVVDAMQRKIAMHSAPALWWIGPCSRPVDIDQLLQQQGLTPAGQVPGMALDLAGLAMASEKIDGFAIRQVDSAESRRLWGRIAAIGTGFTDAATAALASLEAGITDPQYHAQYRYIGYLDGVPVATSALVLEAGVAGVYAVATLPEARRKGIGNRMTREPLMKAKDMGYRVAILQSSSAGFPIYERIGFSEVCTYRLYLQNA